MTYRCSLCDVNWPNIGLYCKCPIHGTETWKTNEEPVTIQQSEALIAAHEARSKVHREFEAFYAEREKAALERTLEQIRSL